MRSALSKLVVAEAICEQISRPKTGRVGVCTGCFDVLHSGHAVFFEQCKEHCEKLIVVVGRTRNISALKPGRPVNSEANRQFLVAAMEAVDFVVLGDVGYSNSKIDCVAICDVVMPDVYIVNDDDSALMEKQTFCIQRGIELQVVPRTCPGLLDATSTTEVIGKIHSLCRDDRSSQ